MKSLIVQLFGSYVPLTYEVYEGEGTITQVVDGIGGLDYEWIAGVVLFAITLVCVFKIVGGLFCGKYNK